MKTTLVVATGVVALAVAGCGSSNSSSSSSTPSSSTTSSTPAPAAGGSSTTGSSSGGGGGGSTVKLSADPSGNLKFTTSTASTKAGTVTLAMHNPASLQHGIAIEGNGVDKDGAIVGQGGTSTVTVKLKAGTYTFYCPVPGHRQAGMQGKLTVK